LLHSLKVERVIDVRRFPVSRFEHFGREKLQALLEAAGIGYSYLGKELGGYRKGGYESYVSSQDFHSGLRQLEEIAREETAAILCAERFPWRCHRRFIGGELERRGWRVDHIIDETRRIQLNLHKSG
jgi:uncharacterized protein (DUF488 family)